MTTPQHPAMDLDAMIERLAELDARATKEPWPLRIDEYSCSIRIGTEHLQAPYQKPYGRGQCEQQIADGELISLAGTHRSTLLSLLRELRAARGVVELAYDDTYCEENFCRRSSRKCLRCAALSAYAAAKDGGGE